MPLSPTSGACVFCAARRGAAVCVLGSSSTHSSIHLHSFGDAAALRDAGAGLVGWWHGVDEPTGDGTVDTPLGCILRVTPAHGRFLGRVHTPAYLAGAYGHTSSSGAVLGMDLPHTPPLLELFARRHTSAAAPVAYDTRAVVACPADGGPVYGLGGSSASATRTFEPPALDGEEAAQLALAQPSAEYTYGGVDTTLFTAFTSAASAPTGCASPADAAVDTRQPQPKAPQRLPASLLRLGLHQFLLQHLPTPALFAAAAGRGTPLQTRRRAADDDVDAGQDPAARGAAAAKWGRVADEVSKMDARGPQHRAFLVSAVRAAVEQTLTARGSVMNDAGLRNARGARVAAAIRHRREASQPTPVVRTTRFTRIDPHVASGAGPDPCSALYLGAYGPHGPEVLQLARGRWGDSEAGDDDCVTAVKLTGDRCVPAGLASFRARVGRAHRLDHAYPEELGVLACYKGQGRAAKPGFSDARWVDGELLLLDGKGGALTGGASIGLVWAVPGERRFLILLSRLQLPA